jgi:hypothetical protein
MVLGNERFLWSIFPQGKSIAGEDFFYIYMNISSPRSDTAFAIFTGSAYLIFAFIFRYDIELWRDDTFRDLLGLDSLR